MLEGWSIVENQNEFTIHRTYPDGTDVIISIKRTNNGYEVWSSAEHRSSGPNNHLDGTAETLESAEQMLWLEAEGWDDDLLS